MVAVVRWFSALEPEVRIAVIGGAIAVTALLAAVVTRLLRRMQPRHYLILLLIATAAGGGYLAVRGYLEHKEVLKRIISRLEADSRIAEVLVTGVTYDESTGKTLTTIKFLEYGIDGKALEPRYFTFPGNVIQFQSLVIRFNDMYIRNADALRGKSAYLFWRVFMLDGKDTVEYEITPVHHVPGGYLLQKEAGYYEKRFWERFWDYALDAERAGKMGIKNAQIEAPGTMFVPGTLYTIRIEHDGGIRIDATPLSPILRGERILE